jgi:hypothetical protein
MLGNGTVWLSMFVTIMTAVIPDLIINVVENIYNNRLMKKVENAKKSPRGRSANNRGLNFKLDEDRNYMSDLLQVPPLSDRDDVSNAGSEKSEPKTKGKNFNMFRRKKIRFDLSGVRNVQRDETQEGKTTYV